MNHAPGTPPCTGDPNGAPLRIALFGGSFDPVHLGHLEIARLAMSAMRLDQVRFLPCRISPHKPGGPSASDADRLIMLRLALKGIPWAVVDEFDLHAPPPSYSYLTALEMRRRFPEAELFWLLGRDQWDALPDWKEPQQLAAMLEFIVFARDGIPRPRAGWRMHFIEGSHPASATAIRQAAGEGRLPLDRLPPEVADHMIRNRLYRG